jgi:hypothetical protein
MAAVGDGAAKAFAHHGERSYHSGVIRDERQTVGSDYDGTIFCDPAPTHSNNTWLHDLKIEQR